MAIVTFLNDNLSQIGKTMSIVAIATNMAIDNNFKILVVSTTNKYDSIEKCFWEEKRKRTGFLGQNVNLETENGIKGLERVVRSNKLMPQIITNYTKIVFKGRLEFLIGKESIDNDIQDMYPEIIQKASQYYDMVLVDLDGNVSKEAKAAILQMTDLKVHVINQKMSIVENVYNEINKEDKTKNMVILAKYDKHSKYNDKNIGRYLKLRESIFHIQYNTLYFEAAEEGEVATVFLNWKKNLDSEDRNAKFLEEVKECSDCIVKKVGR